MPEDFRVLVRNDEEGGHGDAMHFVLAGMDRRLLDDVDHHGPVYGILKCTGMMYEI